MSISYITYHGFMQELEVHLKPHTAQVDGLYGSMQSTYVMFCTKQLKHKKACFVQLQSTV